MLQCHMRLTMITLLRKLDTIKDKMNYSETLFFTSDLLVFSVLQRDKLSGLAGQRHLHR